MLILAVGALAAALTFAFRDAPSDEAPDGPRSDPTAPGHVDIELGGEEPGPHHPTGEAGRVDPPPAPGPDEDDPPERTHVVEEGDTLRGLARRFYDDPDRWRDIQRANDLDGTVIHPGEKLVIPR